MWTICIRLTFIPSCLLHTITQKTIWHRALPDITKQTLNGIGRLNMSVHRLRKRIKGEEMLFVLS